MTPERLAEIQARVDAATPGPWVADVDVRGDCVVWGPGGQFLANAQAEPHWVPWPDRNELRTVAFDADRRDVEFIARARQDVVDLLAEVKRLSAARTQDAARYVASTPSEACFAIGYRMIHGDYILTGAGGQDEGSIITFPAPPTPMEVPAGWTIVRIGGAE